MSHQNRLQLRLAYAPRCTNCHLARATAHTNRLLQVDASLHYSPLRIDIEVRSITGRLNPRLNPFTLQSHHNVCCINVNTRSQLQ